MGLRETGLGNGGDAAVNGDDERRPTIGETLQGTGGDSITVAEPVRDESDHITAEPPETLTEDRRGGDAVDVEVSVDGNLLVRGEGCAEFVRRRLPCLGEGRGRVARRQLQRRRSEPWLRLGCRGARGSARSGEDRSPIPVLVRHCLPARLARSPDSSHLTSRWGYDAHSPRWGARTQAEASLTQRAARRLREKAERCCARQTRRSC